MPVKPRPPARKIHVKRGPDPDLAPIIREAIKWGVERISFNIRDDGLFDCIVHGKHDGKGFFGAEIGKTDLIVATNKILANLDDLHAKQLADQEAILDHLERTTTYRRPTPPIKRKVFGRGSKT